LEEHVRTPLVILFHEYTGMDEALYTKAQTLVNEGFLVGVADLYGKEHRDLSPEKARELLRPLRKNRLFLRERAMEACEALSSAAGKRREEIFLLGFSLGGGAVLELIRCLSYGGAVSVYGYLDSPFRESEDSGETPLLVIHGMKDGVVLPGDLLLFMGELERRKWSAEVVLYSGVGHGFCNPLVPRDLSRGNYYDRAHHVKAWNRGMAFFHSLKALRE
jgi:dienelactone hydrolase